ncbi:unnamed protein product, partial [Polarella glacialis]
EERGATQALAATQVFPKRHHRRTLVCAVIVLASCSLVRDHSDVLAVALLARHQALTSEPEQSTVESAEPTAARKVEYVVENVWKRGSQLRALELDAAPLKANGMAASGGDGGLRLLVPLRLQDVHFLRLVGTEHLRVDLWPHRAPEPHVHVRILTDALSLYPPPEKQKSRRWGRFMSSNSSQWLTLMQATVHMPRGLSLMGCRPEWRWADFNETDQSWREAISPPFRVLEIACPRRQVPDISICIYKSLFGIGSNFWAEAWETSGGEPFYGLGAGTELGDTHVLEVNLFEGDPISPVFFNAVFEKAMRKARQRWDEKGHGIEMEQGRLLQNLRFADHVLLVASSLHDLREMLGDLMEVAKEMGLEMHLGKTKILANSIGQEQRRMRTTVSVRNQEVEFLALGDSTMYLGRSLSFGDYHGTEIQHRISKGWNKVWSLKKTLCDRSHSLKARLKLFDATITPTVLYGSCSWTLTAARERMLQTVQRRMLRKIIVSNRRMVPMGAEEDGASSVSSPADGGLIDFNNDEEDQEQLEPWLDWIKRLTHTAEDQMRMEGIDDWVRQQRRRKWKWAGHAARRTDGRWSTTIIHWTPTDGRRRVGHPGKRWIDCIDHVMSRCSNVGRGDWFLLAQVSDHSEPGQSKSVQAHSKAGECLLLAPHAELAASSFKLKIREELSWHMASEAAAAARRSKESLDVYLAERRAEADKVRAETVARLRTCAEQREMWSSSGVMQMHWSHTEKSIWATAEEDSEEPTLGRPRPKFLDDGDGDE